MSASIGFAYICDNDFCKVGVETNHSATSRVDSSELFTLVTSKQSLETALYHLLSGYFVDSGRAYSQERIVQRLQ